MPKPDTPPANWPFKTYKGQPIKRPKPPRLKKPAYPSEQPAPF